MHNLITQYRIVTFSQTKIGVDHVVGVVVLPEEGEQVLPHRLDAGKERAVDRRGSVREAAVGRGGAELPANEALTEPGGHAVYRVSLDHRRCGAAECDE